MAWLTNELLFYGGIAIAAGSVLLAVGHAIASHIRWIRLNICLDEEYGKEEKR